MRKLILLLFALPLTLAAQTTRNGTIITGPSTNKPPTCSVGDQFNTTDTGQVYTCNPVSNIWNIPVGAQGPTGPAGPGISVWFNSITYTAGAVVSYMGSLYSSIASGNLNNVPTNPSFWTNITGGAGGGVPFIGPNPWFDITNATYAGGAKCDGTTDDTAAIEAARAAAVSAHGGTVFFPPNATNTGCVYNPPSYGNPLNVITFLLESSVILKATWQITNFYNIIGNPTGISQSGNPNFKGAITQAIITPQTSSLSPVINVRSDTEAYIANIAIQGYTGTYGLYVDQSPNSVISNVLSDGSSGTSSTCALTLNSSFGYKVIDGTYAGSVAGPGSGGSICLTSTHLEDPPRLINIFGSGPSSSITIINKGIHMSASISQAGPAATNLNINTFLVENIQEAFFTFDSTNTLVLRKLRITNGSISDNIGGPYPLITCVAQGFQDVVIDAIDGGTPVFDPSCNPQMSKVLVNGGNAQNVGLSSGYVGINGGTSSIQLGSGEQIGEYDDRSSSFNYAIDIPDYVIQCGANTNQQLPDATAYVNQLFIVKRDSSTAGACTITPLVGGQNIDGASSYILAAGIAESWAEFYSDGTNWRVLGASNPKPLLASPNTWTGTQTFGNVTIVGTCTGCTSTGVVSTTGTPASGNLTKFSGAATITNTDLAGDATTSGTSNVTVVGVNGASPPASTPVVGTNASKQIVASTAHNEAVPMVCPDTSGSGTAQVCNTTPTFTPVAGDTILYTTTTTNTGDVTVNVNALGVKHIRKWQGSGTLVSGDLVMNTPMLLTYDGTYWEIYTIGNSPAGTGTVTSITATAPLTGGVITSTGSIGCTTCLLGSALSAGVVHAPGSSQTMTSGAVALATEVSGQMAITHVGSAGLSGTSPITAASTGAIGCATCTVTIGSGTATLGTSAISSGTCASVVTVSASGVATTDDIIADFNADPTSTVGYQPSTSGTLNIIKYPTANNVNFKVCNSTASSVTPGAVTLNWRVTR